MKAWVDTYPHFGNVVTSRVEGVHALLKSHLKKSTLDLFEAWRAIKHALMNQLRELRSNQAKQQIRSPIELSGPLYGVVRGWVSHEALRKVEEQRKLLTKNSGLPSPNCTGSFSRSQGLPCVHKLEALLSQNKVLQREDFHPHWHLIRSGTTPFLLEPRQHIDSANTNSSLPQSSNRRELSGFEAVEATTRQRAPPRCTRCNTLGHTRTSQTCPLRHAELQLRVRAELQRPQEVPEFTSDLPVLEPTPDLLSLDVREQVLEQALEQVDQVLDQQQVPEQPIKHDDPRAIYQRYITAREAWYKDQRPGANISNKMYRKAMGLPLRYTKASYDWCLDYKQMTKHCKTSTGTRDWTREEMMAYLDWDRSEAERIDIQVAQESAGGLPNRRGMGGLWTRAGQDCEEQQALYSISTEQVDDDCIIVRV